MADINVTQGAVQVLVTPQPTVAVTQAVAQVLVKPHPTVAITQAVAQVLYRITYDYIPPSVFTNLTFRPL